MKFKISWIYQSKNKSDIPFASLDWIEGEQALILAEELESLGRAKELYFEDEMGTEWTKKELKKLLEEVEEEPQDLILYFDGGFVKEEKIAGLGAVIYYKQGKKKYRIRINERFEEMETNNEAEYAALFFALGVLEELGVHHMPCHIRGDSQVVIKQLEGEWPCYENVLNQWLDRIEEKLKGLGIKPFYEAISRKENKEADKLANQAIEGKMVNSKMQLLK